ncbi:hypothetical protein AFLA_005883 [Aspergillus flavus NRRL3357]|nr:hypothetical protein AFLA_005883 [Aspergillus flavus NRRL3357]
MCAAAIFLPIYLPLHDLLYFGRDYRRKLCFVDIMSPFISATSSRRCPVTDCPQLLISEHHLALQIRNLRAAFPRQSIGVPSIVEDTAATGFCCWDFSPWGPRCFRTSTLRLASPVLKGGPCNDMRSCGKYFDPSNGM